MNLSAHGSYQISNIDNILITEAIGPFNEITLKKFLEDSKDITVHFDDKPWGSLSKYSGNGVFTPEAEQSLLDITKARATNNLTAIAAVITKTSHADLLQMQLTRVYQMCNIQFCVFADEEAALRWLRNVLIEQRAVS